MKNESISFESTLGSPSKPKQPNVFPKPKQIFLVNYILENQTSKPVPKKFASPQIRRGQRSKGSKTKNKFNQKKKNIELHILDFDAILNNIINPDKDSKKLIVNQKRNIINNEPKLKLIGFKRFRVISMKNPSIPKSKKKFHYR